jgi:ribosomal protein L30
LRGLGLRKPNHIVEVEDSAAVRGMVAKVQHLIVVLEG